MTRQEFFRDLPVLVTGAAGFIGSHLVERLVALGARVRCLVRRTSRRDRLPQGVELAFGELATGEGVAEAARGIALVFHVAGVTKALLSETYHSGNVLATRNLLRALGQNCHRLVQVSSLAAAGPGSPVTEDSAPQPVSVYGRSKLAAEEAVRASPFASRSVIVRPPVVFGPRDTDVLELLRAARRGWMPVVGRPRSRFSLIYVEDLVEGLLAAAASQDAGGRIYFLAAPEPLTWRDFAHAVGQVLGRKVRLVRVPAPLAWLAAWGSELASRWRGRPGIFSRDKLREALAGDWVCDVTRAQRELGFTARTPLAQALRRTVQWYREAGWL